MADQPKTGSAEVVSMSAFLAKARKLDETKPIAVPASRGAGWQTAPAANKKWSRRPKPVEVSTNSPKSLTPDPSAK